MLFILHFLPFFELVCIWDKSMKFWPLTFELCWSNGTVVLLTELIFACMLLKRLLSLERHWNEIAAASIRERRLFRSARLKVWAIIRERRQIESGVWSSKYGSTYDKTHVAYDYTAQQTIALLPTMYCFIRTNLASYPLYTLQCLSNYSGRYSYLR